MAVTLTPTTSTTAGVVYAAATAADVTGNQFVNPTGRAVVEVINGAGAPITGTFVTQGVYSTGAATYPIADLAVTVTNGTTKIVGPFDKALFNDTNGFVQVTWSSITSVTVRVLEMGTG